MPDHSVFKKVCSSAWLNWFLPAQGGGGQGGGGRTHIIQPRVNSAQAKKSGLRRLYCLVFHTC